MMTRPLLQVSPDEEASASWVGVPPIAVQQLWFTLQRHPWTSLAVIPADDETSGPAFARPLHDVGRLVLGDRLRLLDVRTLKLEDTAAMILEMTGSQSTAERPRFLLQLDSVLSRPSGVPVALAADCAVLCVELGKTRLAGARKTLEILGKSRFLGCITLPPR